MSLENLYLALPASLQNLACSYQGWRIINRRYKKFSLVFDDVKERHSLDGMALHSFQTKRLQDHFTTASMVPFWADTFKKLNINPNAKDIWHEFYKLPILTKSYVKQECARIINSHIPKKLTINVNTSGTTGSGLKFKTTKKAEQEQWAIWWRYRYLHGLTTSTWCGYFGGRSIVPLHKETTNFWRVNQPGKQVMFSAYHLNEDTVNRYVRCINNYAFEWLHGYPSILSLLAGYILNNNLDINTPPKLITIGSENLLPQQKDIIEKAFSCSVRQHYGLAEAVANISEHSDGRLTVDEDFSFVEFIKVECFPNTYRIVGTNWSNPAFPLFRYDTGDLVQLPNNQTEKWRQVLSIDGRNDDFITLPNGTKLGRLGHIFKNFIEIREAQIYQDVTGSVTLRIVKNSDYDRSVERRLLSEAKKRMGSNVCLTINYVDSIERTLRGKLKFVISEVK